MITYKHIFDAVKTNGSLNLRFSGNDTRMIQRLDIINKIDSMYVDYTHVWGGVNVTIHHRPVSKPVDLPTSIEETTQPEMVYVAFSTSGVKSGHTQMPYEVVETKGEFYVLKGLKGTFGVRKERCKAA